ncbi:adenosylmethionine--8-amino-7-oxononanoate transaminase [Desulfonatronospira sp.]|uniref:adenosylmethionine--8-amino-7-oxononanoate transaminase n=1 Tax=Desulfonatronospira sp. TaxID=1962951 RepID=UPI0025B9C588|nr:adenosylmethionine--8-amino-7-oxononanoate transaminase [Desulfonatronospira sp.]
MDWKEKLSLDREHIWHPYTSLIDPLPVYPVESASGVRIRLATGQELIDGMSSWWAMIHGYNHPELNQALARQSEKTSHVMFGGLTHEPAIDLARELIRITPEGLDKVFFCDSGSVSVEVALKMALQYWQARGDASRKQFLSLRCGYHGDTFGAMSVCDPHNGMHSLYSGFLPRNIFAPAPESTFDQECSPLELQAVEEIMAEHHKELAAFILEPIVQGAGGMRMYSPDYLARVRELCRKYHVLLIADEIATGFGRTGRLFACEHAGITPDIICLGKALTGGYMSMAATLCTTQVAETICRGDPGVFMHGPTFMANPLACSVALASIRLLQESGWQEKTARIQEQMQKELMPGNKLPGVRRARVLGAIGVLELHRQVPVGDIQKIFVQDGVWIRPFMNLIYIMPPYIIESGDLSTLTSAMLKAAKHIGS